MSKWFYVPFTGEYSVLAGSKEEALVMVKEGKCGMTGIHINEDDAHEENCGKDNNNGNVQHQAPSP